EYKFQPLTPTAEIPAKFDGSRAEFLRKLFARAAPLRTWFQLDVAAAAEALKEPRGRIVAALNYLEEQGDLTIQTSGVRLGYRRLTTPVREPLVKKIADRFAERERRDVQRLEQVLAFARLDGCRTRYLGEYFGDLAAMPCGHCGWCLGERIADLPAAPARRLG